MKEYKEENKKRTDIEKTSLKSMVRAKCRPTSGGEPAQDSILSKPAYRGGVLEVTAHAGVPIREGG